MITNRTDPFPLFDLPEEVNSKQIYPDFSLKECGLFAQGSHAAEKATAFLRLLPSAVDAEPKSYNPKSYKPGDETKLAAIAILKRHPELLFRKGMVVDHLGRKILASPYQLFLGAGDIWALKQVHDAILPKINDGEAQAEAQFKEQFPHCQWPFDPNKGEEQLYDDRNKAQKEQTIAQLKVIVGKITADPCTNGEATLEETRKAVAELCQIFAPKEGEVIRTGLHFPLAIMREIFKVYDAQFNPWTGPQLSFFSRKVIGAALCASTAVDGQCCKIGLSNLDMKKGPDRQDGLFCSHPKGIPASLAPIRTKLGREMFVDPYDGYSCFLTSSPGDFDWFNKNGRREEIGAAWVSCGWFRLGFGKLMENKSRNLWELLCGHTKRSQHILSISMTNQ